MGFVISLICVLGILLIILVYGVMLYNHIIKLNNKVKESFSSIDVFLKKRFDLIPNLVKCVKGYTKHEKTVLGKLTRLRTAMNKATDSDMRVKTANKSLPVFESIFALSEKYPDLKADKLFKQLQDTMVEIEDDIAAAKRVYNSNVSKHNATIKKFPNNIVSKIFKWKEIAFYKIESGEEENTVIFAKDKKKDITLKAK